MAKLSARNCKCMVGTIPTEITAKKFSANIKTDMLDVTSFADAGFARATGGVTSCQLQLVFDYDLGAGQLALFTPGTVQQYLEIDLTRTGTPPAFIFGSKTDATVGGMYVETVEMSPEVRGLVTVTVSGQSCGPFTFPIT